MNTELFGMPLPLVTAPMAGGVTTVELSVAASAAGAFPFVAGGYKTATALLEEIAGVRPHAAMFGVNLFVPGSTQLNERAFARYASELAAETSGYGLELASKPTNDDDAWGAKLAMLCANPVPVVSFTFGLPGVREIGRLQRAGSAVLATVTSAAEARAADEAGVDGLIVQGPNAGGHSATWDGARTPTAAPTTDVLAAVMSVTRLPLIAAGGVDGAECVRDLLAAGAAAVAVGTLLLLSDEAGTSPTHRAALGSAEFQETVVTRTFTGRPARSLRNGFIDRHASHEINAYPAVHYLTRELRKRAGAAGDADRLHLWAGTGYRSATTGPAAETLERLAFGL